MTAKKKKTSLSSDRGYITRRVNQLSSMGAKDEEIKAVLGTNTLSSKEMDSKTVRKVAKKLKTKAYASNDLSVNPHTGGIYRESTVKKHQLFRRMETTIEGGGRVGGVVMSKNWASEQRNKFSRMNETQVRKMKTAYAKDKKNQYISALESRYKVMKKSGATDAQLKNARAAIRSVKLLSPTKFVDSLKDPSTRMQWNIKNLREWFYDSDGKKIEMSDSTKVSEIDGSFDDVQRASKIAYRRSAKHKK